MFRFTIHAVVLLAMIGTCAPNSVAQGKAAKTDAAGIWTWERTMRDNKIEFTLELSHDKQGNITRIERKFSTK